MKANCAPSIATGSTQEFETITLQAMDGVSIQIEHFSSPLDTRCPLMIAPAMGAPARSFRSVARTLSRIGHPVVLLDHRGSGPNALSPSRKVDFGVEEYLRRDWPAALDWIEKTYPGQKPFLIGHSFGGQLNSIFAGQNPDRIGGLVNLCAVWIHFRYLGDLPVQLRGLAFYLVMRLAANVIGYAPGDKVGWGSRFAVQHIRDWSSWGILGRYKYKGGDGRAALRRVRQPTLAISFSDDVRLGPKPACDRFCSEMTSADLTRWHLTPEELGREKVDHFGALKSCDALWLLVADWIDVVSSPETKKTNQSKG